MKNVRTKLNYTLYTLLVIGVLSGCTRGDELKNVNSFKDYEVIKIEDCEYIMCMAI